MRKVALAYLILVVLGVTALHIYNHTKPPSEHMVILQAVEKQYLPTRPISSDKHDKGCETNWKHLTSCDIYIANIYGNDTPLRDLRTKLPQDGWKITSSPGKKSDYGYDDGYARYAKIIEGQDICITTSTNNPLKKITEYSVFIKYESADSDYKC